jgi:predicted nucleic acid-binding protein
MSFMGEKYFVDASILMYAHDTAAGAKHDRAKVVVEPWWREQSGVVSTQVSAGALRQPALKGRRYTTGCTRVRRRTAAVSIS